MTSKPRLPRLLFLPFTLLLLCGCAESPGPATPQEIRSVTLRISTLLLGEESLEVRLGEAPASVTWRSGELEREGILDEAVADELRRALVASSFWSLPSTVGDPAFDSGERRILISTSRGTAAIRVLSWTGHGDYSTWQTASRMVELVEGRARAALR